MELTKNSRHSVVIEGYSSEGLGIAHVDGRVVFVHGAVRDEKCVIQILKVLKNCAFAKVMQVEELSSHRQEPACPYFGRCGGCDFWHISYEEELRAKRQRVDDALQRIGGLQLQTEAIYGAEEMRFYRNKSQYPVSKEGKAGFYRSRTHEVIAAERCLIQKPEADAAKAAVEQWMARYAVPGYDEVSGKGLVRHIYVRSNREGESLICLLANGEKLPHEGELVQLLREACPKTVGVVLGINRRRDNVILGDNYRTLWGSDRIEDTLCGLRFSLSVPSFYQINRDQAEKLYGLAVEMAGLTGEETVLDLYCGTGTITLAMAQKAARAIGAEIVPEAIEDAKENALRNGMEGKTEFYCADAAQIAGELARQQLRPDVICVDPPRKGLAPEVIGHVCAMQPQRVVYVSCDPATLARDLKLFDEQGYEAVRAAAVDMFPRTVHVESVVLMERRK